jgi:hypothetical protein
MWESRQRFPRAVECEETCFGSPHIPLDRHFHGAPGLLCGSLSSRAAPGYAPQQSPFRLLHCNGSFGIGLPVSKLFRFADAQDNPELGAYTYYDRQWR